MSSKLGFSFGHNKGTVSKAGRHQAGGSCGGGSLLLLHSHLLQEVAQLFRSLGAGKEALILVSVSA